MGLIRLSVMASAVCLLFVNLASAETKPDPREKIETLIPYGIKLLEAKEYAKFLQEFVPPDDFKRITKDLPLENFAKDFGASNAQVLLAVLKGIKDEKPKLDADGKVATFELSEKVKEAAGGKPTIKFTKVEKFWYINN